MSRRRFLKTLLWTAGSAGLGCAYPVFIEPWHVQVNRLRVPVPGLPAAWDGLRIAHMTDLHRSPFVSAKYLDRCIAIANGLKPDLTVFTGDYITHRGIDPADFTVECARCMGRARARYGVFATLGNHDHWYDADRVTRAIESAGIPVLRNRHLTVPVNGESFPVVGLGDLWTEGMRPERAFAGVEAPMALVLMHNPDGFRHWNRPGAHLILAGHTHGGQVNIPFVGPPIVPAKFPAGFYYRGDATMYVNRGLGMIFPPVRFNCPPEIALFELRRA